MYIHQFLLVHNVDYPTPEEFETRENVSNEETPTCSSQEAMEVVKGAQMGDFLASDWSSDVMTGSGMGYR